MSYINLVKQSIGKITNSLSEKVSDLPSITFRGRDYKLIPFSLVLLAAGITLSKIYNKVVNANFKLYTDYPYSSQETSPITKEELFPYDLQVTGYGTFNCQIKAMIAGLTNSRIRIIDLSRPGQEDLGLTEECREALKQALIDYDSVPRNETIEHPSITSWRNISAKWEKTEFNDPEIENLIREMVSEERTFNIEKLFNNDSINSSSSSSSSSSIVEIENTDIPDSNLLFDVVISGAGPGGITNAVLMKAKNPNLNICVIDKRASPTRNHGLDLAPESIQEILNFLNKSENTQNDGWVNEVKSIFSNWKALGFVRTSEIELELAQVAMKMGVVVLRGKEFNFDGFDKKLLNPQIDLEKLNFQEHRDDEQPQEANQNGILKNKKRELRSGYLNRIMNTKIETELLEGNEGLLQRIFQDAKVVIGADGSHSFIRKAVMDNKKSHNDTINYLIELKYQTKGDSKVRSNANASIHALKCGTGFHSTSNSSKDGYKPATLHLFVDKQTFDEFRTQDEDKNVLTGTFEHAWTLQEVKERATTHPKLAKVYETMMVHLQHEAKNEPRAARVSTLPVKLYLSEETTKLFHDRRFVLIGDSNNGLALQEGANAALKEAAWLAEAVLKAKSEDIFRDSNSYNDYALKTKNMIKKKMRWIRFKNNALIAAGVGLKYTIGPVAWSINWIFHNLTKPFRGETNENRAKVWSGPVVEIK